MRTAARVRNNSFGLCLVIESTLSTAQRGLLKTRFNAVFLPETRACCINNLDLGMIFWYNAGLVSSILNKFLRPVSGG
jgi:hypothetical protein